MLGHGIDTITLAGGDCRLRDVQFKCLWGFLLTTARGDSGNKKLLVTLSTWCSLLTTKLALGKPVTGGEGFYSGVLHPY